MTVETKSNLDFCGHRVAPFRKALFHGGWNVLHELDFLVGHIVFVKQLVFPGELAAEPLDQTVAEDLEVAATRRRHTHVGVAGSEFDGAVVGALRVLRREIIGYRLHIFFL